MNKRTLAVASAALLTFAGGAYAVAGGSAPTAITSSVTDKLTDAITAKYPGSTIVGIRSETGGGYDVDVRKSDGTEVDVTVDADFKVTGERAGGMRGGMGGGMGGMGHGGMMGHGGPGMVDTAALAKTLGVSEDKLTAALDKVRQANDPRGDFAAAIAKALGASTSDVQSVLDAQHSAGDQGGPGDHHGGPGGPDNSTLVTALAKKLNVSESKVKDALDAARPDKTDRQAEIATALAKELGLDADKVQKALEAQRPAAPAGRP